MQRWIQDIKETLGIRVHEVLGLVTSLESFGHAGEESAIPYRTCYEKGAAFSIGPPM